MYTVVKQIVSANTELPDDNVEERTATNCIIRQYGWEVKYYGIVILNTSMVSSHYHNQSLGLHLLPFFSANHTIPVVIFYRQNTSQ